MVWRYSPYPGGGVTRYRPSSWDRRIGDWWRICRREVTSATCRARSSLVGLAQAVGGMSTVAATLASEFRADDAVELSCSTAGEASAPAGI